MKLLKYFIFILMIISLAFVLIGCDAFKNLTQDEWAALFGDDEDDDEVGIPRDGLIGEWLFTSASLEDTSVNSNNATIGGAIPAPIADRFANPNNAYTIATGSASEYIELNTPANFIQGLSTLSISLWFKKPYNGIVSALLSNASATDATCGGSIKIVTLSNPDNKLEFLIDNNYGGVWEFVTASTAYPQNNWNHVVCIMEGSSFKIYENNQLKGTGTLPTVPSDHTPPLISTNIVSFRLGGNVQNTAEFYSGDLDDVRIYDRALNVDEIAALFNE